MRLPFFTLFLCNLTLFSLFPTIISALHPYAFSRRRDQSRASASSVLTSRQYHIARDLLDVCINANVNLLADVSQVLGLGSVLDPLDLGTNIELCLCLQDLDLYLETNDNVQVLIGLLGKNTIGALITAVVNTSPQSQQCSFPQHAHHTCNTDDPCHYECDTPYVLQGGECVCAPPYSSCNDVCDLHPQGCGSTLPRSLHKRTNAIVTIAQARSFCKSHETVCGVPGQEQTLVFECIDANSTADSCGGCTTPHPFYEAEPIHHTAGQDCTAIPNAQSTSCSRQRCVVHSCVDGWVPSSDKATCVPDTNVVVKMRKVRKRSNPVTANATATTVLDSDLVSQLVEIVKSLLDLNAHAPTESISSTSFTATISGLLADVNAATATLINSTLLPSSLPTYVGALLDSCRLLDNTLHNCNCVHSLGLSDLAKDVYDLIAAILALQSWCQSHPIVVSTPSTSAPSIASVPPSTGTGNPVIVGLTDILTAGTLGLLGQVKSGVDIDGVDGLLGPGTSDLLNNLLNRLLIGPANYKRQDTPALPTSANATVSVDDNLLSQVAALVRSILDLGGLLNLAPPSALSSSSSGSVGPSSIPAVPSLWTSLEQATVDLVQSSTLELLCPSLNALYVTERQLEAALGLSVGGAGCEDAYNELVSIINYTLALQVLCQGDSDGGSGQSATFSIAVGPTVIGTSLPASTHAASSISRTTIHSATTATSTVLSIGVTHAGSPTSKTVTIVSRPTVTSLSISTGSPATSLHPPSTTAVHPAPPPTSIILGSGGIPIVVGLDNLLNGLGLGDVKGVVTVGDGLLGDDVDSSVDNLLDGLDIGPHGVRKREVGGLKSERRQLTTSANATATVGGSLVTAIQQLVDLVLGLNASGNALPPVAASSSATPSIDSSLVDNVVDVTMALLSSSTYSELFSCVNELVNASVASLNALEGCSCAGDLGLEEVQDYLAQVVEASEGLLGLCSSLPAGSPTTVSPVSSQPPASDDAIEIGLSKLLSALGLNVKADTVVSGLLDDDLDNTVNSALDVLGIGPSGMKRRVMLAER